MAFRFFVVSARDGGEATEELNRFLRGHRVLAVDRRWVDQGTDSFWCFCIDYLESQATSAAGTKGPTDQRNRVDYREVLSPADFSRFVALRSLRAEIAKAEAVPVYTIFTNEQLARMVQGKVASRADLAKIEGIGESRLEKYAGRFLDLLSRLGMSEHEAGRPVDGADPGPG